MTWWSRGGGVCCSVCHESTLWQRRDSDGVERHFAGKRSQDTSAVLGVCGKNGGVHDVFHPAWKEWVVSVAECAVAECAMKALRGRGGRKTIY